LFAIDALARAEKLDHAARHVLRLERAQPLVEIIRGEVEAARDASLPASALGKSANYQVRREDRELGKRLGMWENIVMIGMIEGKR
jgi:hypothetical protein